MGKSKVNVQSIYSLPSQLKSDKFLPIYFFFGEDIFTIEDAVNTVVSGVKPLLASDFDYEIINCDKNILISQIIDSALAFPFGEGKKLIVVKNFEKISDKKLLSSYVENPTDFTVLVISHYDKITDFKKEPVKTLLHKNYLFEAKELKGDDLIRWLIDKAKALNLKLSSDNARALVEITGEDKSILEMQLTKFMNYVNDSEEISFEVIQSLASETKEYNIFNLQDALGLGDKVKALEIGYNLIDNGKEMVYIITMLTRYISTIAQIPELTSKASSDYEAAKAARVSYYYYLNCKKAKFFQNEKKLHKAAKALLNADLTTKTTAADPKVVFTILITEMLK